MNEQDLEIDEIFKFLAKKIAVEHRPEFFKSIGFSSVAEIKAIECEERKESALERLRIEKRKRMSVLEARFKIEQVESGIKEKREPTNFYIPKVSRIEKTSQDD